MRRRTLAVAAVTLAALSLTACGSSPTDAAEPPPATVGGGAVSVVDPAGFAAAAAAEGVVLLDVRTPQEFAAGHLRGARNIDVESPDFTAAVAALDPGTTYAVYCRSGNRSAAATAYLLDLGFAPPYELGGGILAWQQAGLPVVR
jgi:rhodanese-related sulfurtransferase